MGVKGEAQLDEAEDEAKHNASGEGEFHKRLSSFALFSFLIANRPMQESMPGARHESHDAERVTRLPSNCPP
jgi:hypothetical protein